MIKPVFAQKVSGTHVGDRLLRALVWWHAIIMKGVSEMKPWDDDAQQPCHLFVDAASTPPRLAGVLLIDGRILYTDCAPSASLLSKLKKRSDNQITSLVSSCMSPSLMPGLRWHFTRRSWPSWLV